MSRAKSVCGKTCRVRESVNWNELLEVNCPGGCGAEAAICSSCGAGAAVSEGSPAPAT